MACTTPAPEERDPVCACSLYPVELMSGLDDLSTVIDAWRAVAALTSPGVANRSPDLDLVDREDLTALLEILATLAKWHLARHYAEMEDKRKESASC